MLPVTGPDEITVGSDVIQELADGFADLYQHDPKRLAYVADFQLENLKEVCVWLSDLYSDSLSKATVVSQVALCMSTLRCLFEFGVTLESTDYTGYVKFTGPPEQDLRRKIQTYLRAHPNMANIRRGEVSQCLGYLVTVEQYFRSLDNKAFFRMIWPVYTLLSQVEGNL